MAGPYLALNGRRVVSANVMIPYYGAWCADVTIAVSDVIPLAATLTLGNLTLTGTVYRMASFSGARSARIVGGGAGWRKTLPAFAYANPAGIRASLVLGDAATLVGEKVNVMSDAIVGKTFVRESAPAERLLRQLGGSEWWIDPSGITQVGPRASGAITTQFLINDWSGAKGWFSVSTETISDWMPGRTFSNANVTKAQQIGMTTIIASNDGKLRVNVLSDGVGSQ